MNKFEKYFEKLKNIEGNIAIINDKPVECDPFADCDKCIRSASDDKCSNKILIDWLAEEYIEKHKLTKNEQKLCQVLKNGWLARDRFNGLYFYAVKPAKHSNEWATLGTVLKINDLVFEDVKFDFIKWEDKEPWSVEDILKLEVK